MNDRPSTNVFVTVGTQLAFDRLVMAVDDWAQRSQTPAFAQIGPADYEPRRMDWRRYIPPPEFQQRAEAADVIVAHAGMGSIITALTLHKPLVIMPRRASLREHRNDHQLATADRFRDVPGILVADDEASVAECLDRARDAHASAGIRPFAEPRLINTIREFIHATP